MPRSAPAARSKPAPSRPANDDVRLDDLIELTTFVERYPDVAKLPRMRWLIHTRETNGIEKAGAVFKRCGRWHVCVPRMRDWLLHGEGTATP